MDISKSGYMELIGQEKAKRMLNRSLESHKVPHAYLFRGPEGVGKQLFARGVAEVVNCRQGAVAGACGVCVSCKKYQSGNHPDFTVVSPEKGTIKISQVRELCKALAYPPYESALRVVLLEDVHLMRQEAANALLKTLEEPPEQNLLILTADTSQEVLPTILSRCQVVPFCALTNDETSSILLEHDSELERDEARLLARFSEGSPGKATVLKQAGLIEVMNKLVVILSEPTNKQDSNIGAVLKIAEEMANLKEDLLPFFGLLRMWYRDLLLLEGGNPELVEENRVLHDVFEKRPSYWSSGQLFAKLQAVDKATSELGRNCNRALVCEVLVFSLQ